MATASEIVDSTTIPARGGHCLKLLVRPVVAALFVQADGCYLGLDHVDPWSVSRDARNYSGPLPVVAHPPCQLWVNMAGVNFKRYGGPHNRPGNDGGCFATALAAVLKFGGVLEHPAGSFAWSTFGLARPSGNWWTKHAGAWREYWVCEVWQAAYGHKARKRTWLLYAGAVKPHELRWTKAAGTHQVGWFDRNKPTLGKREANATPIEFRDELIRLALGANARG